MTDLLSLSHILHEVFAVPMPSKKPLCPQLRLLACQITLEILHVWLVSMKACQDWKVENILRFHRQSLVIDPEPAILP